MGRLTTHVLDTALGRPAGGLKIELWAMDGAPEMVSTHTTNADGRVDGPILEGPAFKCGTYELRFHAGDYLKSCGTNLPEPLFLDIIPIRFGIAEPDGHYHVPLLLSPFGFSTYRGS
ncbi:hydroxyisourate hydrolase [Roseibium polysiphoniae]|uniref:5-hydroxyisourate hydrolase n=1 Tax=Roseibium polysiphoniae TaxID=2571221 RepID=A0ABR9C7V8_9HYPH|nr:hydroxyisourate hydrolase [Roseibium polysiphoniae]MBD8875985.1 hydroxyisourate hydrolase [Roseibium polysiphoniae]